MYGDCFLAAALGGYLIILDGLPLELGAVEVLDGDVVDDIDCLLGRKSEAGEAECNSDDVLFHIITVFTC